MIKNLYEEKKYYEVIDLTKEYPGFVGETKWGIVTDLSEDDLYINFYDEIKPYIPFVILPTEFMDIALEFSRNNAKHAMRAIRHTHSFGFDFIADEYHMVTDENDSLNSVIKEEETMLLHQCLNRLTLLQRRCLKMYFFEEKTLKEIAVKENKSFSTIREIFQSGLKNMKTMLLNSGYQPESCNN